MPRARRRSTAEASSACFEAVVVALLVGALACLLVAQTSSSWVEAQTIFLSSNSPLAISMGPAGFCSATESSQWCVEAGRLGDAWERVELFVNPRLDDGLTPAVATARMEEAGQEMIVAVVCAGVQAAGTLLLFAGLKRRVRPRLVVALVCAVLGATVCAFGSVAHAGFLGSRIGDTWLAFWVADDEIESPYLGNGSAMGLHSVLPPVAGAALAVLGIVIFARELGTSGLCRGGRRRGVAGADADAGAGGDSCPCCDPGGCCDAGNGSPRQAPGVQAPGAADRVPPETISVAASEDDSARRG